MINIYTKPDMNQTKSVPQVKGHWLLGNLRQFRINPFQAICVWQHEYGDLLGFKLVGQQCYLISHPKWVEQTLIKQSSIFVKMYNPRKPKGLALILGQGLVTSQGDLWRRQRRLIQPVFQRSNITTMLPKMVTAGEHMLLRWQQLGDKAEVNLSDEMMRLTLEVITQTMFSTSVLGDVEKISHALEVGLRYALYTVSNPLALPLFIPTATNLNFKKACSVLDDVIFEMVARRRKQNSSQEDLLDMLLNAHDENTGERMSDQQIRDEVITIFTAGHETTANLLTWTLYLLAKHPHVLNKLRDELQSLNGRTPSVEDMQSLVYTRAVLNESMRLRPPVGVMMRKIAQETEIDGFRLKSGSLVFYSIYNIHHNSELWDKPEEFLPERFLTQENRRFSFIPFGTGERICIGSHFAMLESQLLLSMIIQQYGLQLIDDQEVEIDMAVSLRPKGGVPVRLKRL